MIRVLQVFTVLNRGGAETMIMNYYRKIDRTKIQFDFLVHREEQGHFEKEITDLGGKIYRLPPMTQFLKYKKELDKFFKEHQEYYIVHAHLNAQGAFVLKAAKKHNVPFRIAHSHIAASNTGIKGIIKNLLKQKLRNNCTHKLACGIKAGEWLFGGKDQFEYVPNAIELENFRFNSSLRKKCRKEFGWEEDNMIVGHVGRFNIQKNHSLIVEVFKHLKDIYPNSKLVLVGEGGLRDKVESQVKNLKLNEDTLFLGVREDVPSLLSAFDIFLFPSLFEGFPVTLIEAQASGLQIFTSKNVTDEVKLTNLVSFQSLSDSPKLWAQKIKESFPYIREKSDNFDALKDFDIRKSVERLSAFYLSLQND